MYMCYLSSFLLSFLEWWVCAWCPWQSRGSGITLLLYQRQQYDLHEWAESSTKCRWNAWSLNHGSVSRSGGVSFILDHEQTWINKEGDLTSSCKMWFFGSLFNLPLFYARARDSWTLYDVSMQDFLPLLRSLLKREVQVQLLVSSRNELLHRITCM